jgi:hypothetical protein
MGTMLRVYEADWPAFTVTLVGEGIRLKSGINTESAWFTVCPALVPITLKFSVSVPRAVRSLTVRVLVCPGVIAAGAKVQMAGELFWQLKVIAPVN